MKKNKKGSDRRVSITIGYPKSYLKAGRDYGEYCTDFIEQNALELYLLGKFKEFGCEELKQKIEDRNPHTKIFQKGIVKMASKIQNKYVDGEMVVASVVTAMNMKQLEKEYNKIKNKKIRDLSLEDMRIAVAYEHWNDGMPFSETKDMISGKDPMFKNKKYLIEQLKIYNWS